ncbi:MAG: hypothetical protein Q4E64_11045 [Phascolarctobacterium sp.]|uniref:hypothetical protein n=1 Tax=Phascolarctobacterium sp. TaxID=2049039 RepID=UPI0026DB5AB8|nr:hypothetical protein [Phascolarctobacterium sp.]MDO4922344.1 hypothetical protein [Phascolarctobacterium sp.]
MPNVLALPLEEATRRLTQAGCSFDVELLLPPRGAEEDFAGQAVRKYVVRQQMLSANRLVLTVVYRLRKEVRDNGSEN